MLYEQARNAIKVGKHPVSIDIACDLASMVLQIYYGDHREDKHTPETIDMKSFLPDSYQDRAKAEASKILKLHQENKGQSELDAKFLYVQMVRSLPTFGVHFFLVRVRKI